MKAAFLTLGCKVNYYETEKMMKDFEQHGFEVVDFHEHADVYVINTCTVTNIADRKSRKMIHRAKKRNPDSIVAAVGCYVESAGRKSGIDGALPNNALPDNALSETALSDLVFLNSQKKDVAREVAA